MRADIGIALDGDADRVVIVDEKGHVVDGDQLMARDRRKLAGRRPARQARRGRDRDVEPRPRALSRRRSASTLARTPVGDRYVLEHMREHGFNVGGEQSGHIILSDYATTGDGLVAALQVLAVVKKQDKPVSRGLPPLRAAAAGPEERALQDRQAAGGRQGPARPSRAPSRSSTATGRLVIRAVRHRAGDPRDGRGRRQVPGRGRGRRHRRGADRRRGLSVAGAWKVPRKPRNPAFRSLDNL